MKLEKHHDDEVNAFIKKCQDILKKKGKGIAWYKMYEDEKIRIVEGMNSLDAFRIEILPKGHPQNLHNPVICADVKGELYRVHGEWRYIEEHVNSLKDDS